MHRAQTAAAQDAAPTAIAATIVQIAAINKQLRPHSDPSPRLAGGLFVNASGDFARAYRRGCIDAAVAFQGDRNRVWKSTAFPLISSAGAHLKSGFQNEKHPRNCFRRLNHSYVPFFRRIVRPSDGGIDRSDNVEAVCRAGGRGGEEAARRGD